MFQQTMAIVFLASSLSCTHGPSSEGIVGTPKAASKPRRNALIIETIRRKDGDLQLEYSYVNTSTSTVWLFGPLFDQEQNGTITRSPTKSYVEAKGDVLVLSKRLVKIPHGLRVEAPQVPAVTKVTPAQTIKGRAVVTLPLRESLPYKTTAQAISEKGITKVRFVLGLLSSYSSPLLTGKDGRGQVYKMPYYGRALMNQSLIHSPLVDFP